MVDRIMNTNPNNMLNAISPKSAGPAHPQSHHDEARVEHYNARVVNAVRTNNVDQLQELFYKENQCFEACNNNGEYLIHLACRRGDLETIRFLVDKA
eukprot:CAMPEP_0198139152 /NCGR_PEP_ID=MMETSP1443-20131203/2494_1 /TAXON_ID=186043 /ORGANISM="Entomoneis sp., Strain CCMP2396" /LENGTH=96 /DNA_ID=CAMNT_0043801195 /DNA_START=65 /DNA_END=355 /DNA_ORIENTATION=+